MEHKMLELIRSERRRQRAVLWSSKQHRQDSPQEEQSQAAAYEVAAASGGGSGVIGPGCAQPGGPQPQERLEGKIVTAFNKFITTSPLINKVKLLMLADRNSPTEGDHDDPIRVKQKEIRNLRIHKVSD
ncbi:hypothetical protein TKK_0017436 [Trichogramma kaykai]